MAFVVGKDQVIELVRKTPRPPIVRTAKQSQIVRDRDAEQILRQLKEEHESFTGETIPTRSALGFISPLVSASEVMDSNSQSPYEQILFAAASEFPVPVK